MKRLLLFFAACLLTLTTWAVPARRYTFTVQQPDGSVITLQLVGDEYFHYYRNVDTGEALTRTSDGSYVPLSSAEKQTRQKVGQQRRAAANAQRAKRMVQRRADGPNRVGGIKPTSGSKRGLVIVVNYSDKKINGSFNQATFSNMFNKVGYSNGNHVGSVRDYFMDQSYGALTIDFDVVGPVTLSKNMAYYGGNDYSDSDEHPGEMIIEAVKLADAAGTDFSKYDWDGDGEVEQVYIIYAGYAESQGGDDDTIWPHESTLTECKRYGDGTGALRLDGVKIDTYACSSELQGYSGAKLAPIGTACHEFSHCLGFPDTYDTGEDGDNFGMDAWDIMASGSYNGASGYGEAPSGYTAYERWQAGWLEPTELTSAATVSGMKNLGTDAEAYILYNPANHNEYLLFENRQPEKWFSYLAEYPAGSGLLITHVDYDESIWASNTVNNVASRQRCTIIPAGKQYRTKEITEDGEEWVTTEEMYNSMLFPQGGTFLTESSHTSCGGKWFNGTTSLGHSITDITNADGLVGFNFDGGGVEDDGNRYTITFDPGTGSCGTTSWTQTTFGESVQLPTAYVASTAAGYTFIGWSETEATGSKPAQILNAKSSYMPTKNVTLYAVYKSTTAGGSGSGGTYTLDYNAESKLKSATLGYGTKFNYTATDGSAWVVKAYKNKGLQINQGKNASIKVPSCPGPITSIQVTDGTARVLKFSADDYTGSNSPADPVSSDESTTATINLTGKNLTTGYIYTTAGSTVITKIVVNYDSTGSDTDYQTRPGTADLKTPSLSFPWKTQTIELGDSQIFTATVTSNPGGATVTYSSDDETVATVGPTTGRVSTKSAGTCTITATIPAVAGVSREAKASYTLTVTEPATTSIYIATQPTKLTYEVGESFDATGMVVKRRFANGGSATITTDYLSWEPSGALSASDTKVTVKYYEDGTWFTADVNITVKALPLYTVTFDACGGSCLTASLTELISGAGVTLPAATTSVAGWKFAGWSTERISENMSASPKIYAADSPFKPTANVTLYAVYVYTETTGGGGSGNYECVTEAPSDWSGDYVIGGYDGRKMYFADGRIGGSKASTGGIGDANKLANVVYYKNEDYVTGESGDLYHVTLVACTGGYLLRTQDGLYNFRSVDGNNVINNGILTSNNAEEAAKYPVVITLEEDGYVTMKSATAEFCLNIDSQNKSYFRFYKRSTAAGITNAIYLYKKQGSVLSSTYTSYPDGSAPLTVGALAKVINGLPSGTTKLSDLQNIVDRILQR